MAENTSGTNETGDDEMGLPHIDTIPVQVGSLTVAMPDMLTRQPADMPDAVTFATRTSQAVIFIDLFEIPAQHAMPFDTDKQDEIIDWIHHGLLKSDTMKKAGLVEVAGGKTKTGNRDAVFYVLKRLTDRGMQYVVSMNIDFGATALDIEIVGTETDTTGMREAAVYEMARKQGVAGDKGEGWARDPYDADYTSGQLMNLSELPEFDHVFLDHPLSTAREIRDVIAMVN